MSGDWYYNDLDSRDLWEGAVTPEEDPLDENLSAAWDRESAAYRTWMSTDYGDINMALSYFDANDDSLEQLADFEGLEDIYLA